MPTPAADAQALPMPRLSHLVDVTAALAAHAERHDRTADLPRDGLTVVHEAGLLTLTVHSEHGGPGGGLADTVRALTALGRGDPSVALISAMTMFAHAASAAWPAELYAQVLAESARQPTLINALRVEPDLGTPARGGLPATTARRTADGWELTGHKIFSTGAAGLRWMQVWARTDEDPVRTGAFLVRADSPGISVERTWDHLGLRASRSDDVTFDRVPVPRGATLGLAEPGPPGADPGGLRAWNALGIAAIYLGVVALAVDRGEQVDAARPGIAKTVATTAAIEAVQRAVALIGDAGLSRRHPLERHLRDVLCGRIHTPQDDVVLTSAGRALLEGHVR